MTDGMLLHLRDTYPYAAGENIVPVSNACTDDVGRLSEVRATAHRSLDPVVQGGNFGDGIADPGGGSGSQWLVVIRPTNWCGFDRFTRR